MKRLSAALGTLLVLSGPALAAPSDQSPAPAIERPATAPGQAGDMARQPGPSGAPSKAPDFRPRPHGERRMGPEFDMRLAARLAAAETLIGIRSEQLDAWRDYTSALIDLLQPPAPPPPLPPGDEAGKAFARQEQMARRIMERAAKADTLLKAIAALREKLTDAQLAALGRIDLAPPPMARGMRGGHGPMDRGPMDRGLMDGGRMGPGLMGFGPMDGGSMGPGHPMPDGGPIGGPMPGMRTGPGEPGPIDAPDGPAPQDGGPAEDGAPLAQ